MSIEDRHGHGTAFDSPEPICYKSRDIRNLIEEGA